VVAHHSATACRTNSAIDQFKAYAVCVARRCRARGNTIDVTTVRRPFLWSRCRVSAGSTFGVAIATSSESGVII
jgi:hypothetical protein